MKRSRVITVGTALLLSAALTFGASPTIASADPAVTPITSGEAKTAWDAAGVQAELASQHLTVARGNLAAATAIEVKANTAAQVAGRVSADDEWTLQSDNIFLMMASLQVATASAALTFANAAVAADQVKLNDLAAAAFRGGSLGTAQIVLSATSPSDLLNQQVMTQAVAGNQVQVMAQAKSDRAAQEAGKRSADLAAAAASKARATAAGDAANAQKSLATARKAQAVAVTSRVSAQKKRDIAAAATTAMTADVAKYHALFNTLSAREKAAQEAIRGAATADAALLTATSNSYSVSTGTIAGLSSEQSAVAQAIASTALRLGLGQRGVLIGEMTGLTESGLTNVMHGDAMGPSSIGVFQQMGPWGTLAQRNDPAQSAQLFFARMVSVPNWQSMQPWLVAQAVQQSEFADGSNYLAQMARAQAIEVAILTATSVAGQSTLGAVPTGVSAKAQIAVQFAKAQIGHPYVWGATGQGSPAAFDCSGLIVASWAQAGVTGLPRASFEMASTWPVVPLDQLQPGDVISYYQPTSHIAMYVGNGMVVSAADEQLGVIYVTVAGGGPNAVGHRVPQN